MSGDRAIELVGKYELSLPCARDGRAAGASVVTRGASAASRRSSPMDAIRSLICALPQGESVYISNARPH